MNYIQSINQAPSCSYGIGLYMAKEMDITSLKRLYNSGAMPMPITKDGNWGFETHEFIMNRIRRGY